MAFPCFTRVVFQRSCKVKNFVNITLLRLLGNPVTAPLGHGTCVEHPVNKQRVALHFSLRLGNLASNYRVCLTVLGGLERLGVSLQSQGLAEGCQMERVSGVGVGRWGGREGASAAEGRDEHVKLKPRPRGGIEVIFPNPTNQVVHSWKLSPITPLLP